MSVLFNRYTDSEENVRFNHVIEQPNDPVTLVVGSIGNDGLLALYSEMGNPIWTKRYAFRDRDLDLLYGARASNGDYLLIGTKSSGGNDRCTILRVSSTGTLIWANNYSQAAPTAFVEIIALDNDEFVFVTQFSGTRNSDSIEVVKINGAGDVLTSKSLNLRSNDQPLGLRALAGSFLLFGGTDANDQGDGYFILFDNQVNIIWSKTVGDNRYQIAKDVLPVGEQFLVVGEYDRRQDGLIYFFDPNATFTDAQRSDLTRGREGGMKRVREVDGSYLMLSEPVNTLAATFTLFDTSLAITWHKTVTHDKRLEWTDMHVASADDFPVRCTGISGNNNDQDGLLFKAKGDVESCSTVTLENPDQQVVRLDIEDWNITLTDTQITVLKQQITVTSPLLNREELCPTKIDLSGDVLVQSPFLYAQAAGSDGSDETVKGFHVRWEFRQLLLDRHLPKGAYSGPSGVYPATYGFNKDDDFFTVYRTPFLENYYTDLDFNTQPNTFDTGGSVREWKYTGLVPVGITGGITNDVTVSFPDVALYDATAAGTDPTVSAIDFIKVYTGEINVNVDGKLFFRIDWALDIVDQSTASTAELRYETVSLSDSTDATSTVLSKRAKFTEPDFAGATFTVCEDVDIVRFDRDNVFPMSLKLYIYDDYIAGVNEQAAWGKIDDFALTLEQAIAYQRLEDLASFQVNGLWPKFNESDTGTGLFKVSVPNYQNRWSSGQGLEYAVERYLDLSQVSTNFTATEAVGSLPIGTIADNSTMDIHYFDLLNFVGVDFHLSRMLGKGYIDALNNATVNDEYIYLVEYDTIADLEDGNGVRDAKHIYMTPHQNILDFKLPPVPELQDPPSYGLTVDNGTVNPIVLTDDDGYTPFADVRFVNVNRQPFQYELDFQTFYQIDNAFSLCDEALPVTFGLEYGLQGEPYIQPELNHDRVYVDGAGVAETVCIPNSETNPVYRHQETEEGIHCYALYSVNWFSRASQNSDEICTDFTQFPKRNTIIPPSNLSVQLVQPELPPILTTSQEQSDYDAIVGDKTYLRVMFDWNYIQHQAYQFADKAQFFFNKQEKRNTRGEITSVTPLTGNRVQVTTTSYDILSQPVIETVEPFVAPGLEDHFEDSLFSVDGLNYRVEQVLDTSGTSGFTPTFILHQIRETNSVEDPTGSNVWVTTETYVSPAVGERFLVTENLGRGKNWDNKLAKSVYLERFSTNDTLEVDGSSNNDGEFNIVSSSYNGSDTEITVTESVNDTVVDGNVIYDKNLVVVGFNPGNNGFLIDGNVTADFAGITDIKVFASLDNDGDYTIASVAYTSPNTNVTLVESINLNSSVGCIAVRKTVPVVDYDNSSSQILVAGDLTAELIPSYKEQRLNSDGTTTELVIGGFVGTCDIVEEFDIYSDDNPPPVGFSNGDPDPLSTTGVYTLTFAGNPLPPHIDPDVSWFRGKVRILEDDSFLPTPLDSRTTAKMKELDVFNISEVGGNLVIGASDPLFDVDNTFAPINEYVPILKGTGIQINYHPSYLLYLTVDETQIGAGPDTNEFNEASILPVLDEGSRKTFLGVRAIDGQNNDPAVDDCASHVSTPAAIVAQEIRPPMAPNLPLGPLYATRPDFYGKSTYTLDISFNNVPYSVLVYKANERRILDTIYKPDTVATIIADLAALPVPDANFTQRWNELVNVVLETTGPNTGEFKEYDGFRFPIPDSLDYVIPQSFTTNTPVIPFNGNDAPGSGVTFTEPGVYDLTMEEVVKEAIASAFTSQTEGPMIYQHLKTGTRTSSMPPRLRDDNNDLYIPSDNPAGYEPTPFAVKLPSGDLRFTDFNIDGGSVSHYFYYGVEISDRQVKSPPSEIAGPIQLVNTRPAKAPSIKKITTQIENADLNIPAAVCFEIEEYIESEGIERIDIYRATDPIDALTVRTMELAGQIDVTGTGGTAGADICDFFVGLDYPLYGEDLQYRLIAMRKITLEDGVTEEYIPSEPSKLVTATLVDPINPPAPCITSENGTATAAELQNVVLKWPQVAYNATYTLEKANDSGNWEEIYSIKSNEAVNQYPPLVGALPDFANFDATVSLPRQDADGNPLYHKFRVRVVNSSGLVNLEDCPITLASGCFDLESVTEFVTYEDSNSFILTELTSQDVDDGANNNPGQITFTATIPAVLPAGHNSFTQLDISITDDLGNTASTTIATPTGMHTFNDGDGDTGSDSLQLNDPNRTYTITTRLYTDFCSTGYRKKTVLSYVHGPCNDLLSIDQVVDVSDSTHTYALDQELVEVDQGVGAPFSLTFTDVSNVAGLASPQTFQQIDVTLTDGFGNTDTKTISTVGDSVTFNDGDNGLVLNDANSNRDYTVSLVLITAECAVGQTYEYQLEYSYDPCEELAAITDVVSFTDASAGSINPLVEGTIDNGVNNPGGSITFTDILMLPTSHTFDSMQITLDDGIGGVATFPITEGGNVTFNTGNGDPGVEIDLGVGNPNAKLSVTVDLSTDLCDTETSYVYALEYTYDPCEELAAQEDVVSFQDGNTPPLLIPALYVFDASNNDAPLEFNDGANNNPMGSITLTEIISSSLPAGDTFTKVDVTIEDGVGGSFTDEITTVGGSVTISHGQGGLEMNASDPNKTYTIAIVVFTALCPDGVTFVYAGRYSFGL